jgi:hypothetical protein
MGEIVNEELQKLLASGITERSSLAHRTRHARNSSIALRVISGRQTAQLLQLFRRHARLRAAGRRAIRQGDARRCETSGWSVSNKPRVTLTVVPDGKRTSW